MKKSRFLFAKSIASRFKLHVEGGAAGMMPMLGCEWETCKRECRKKEWEREPPVHMPLVVVTNTCDSVRNMRKRCPAYKAKNFALRISSVEESKVVQGRAHDLEIRTGP